jgi:zinc/manganese transport system substrate-binding protein
MHRLTLAIAAAAMVAVAHPAAATINVVTSIPDLADVTRHIGGDLVEVKSLATGVEDIHAVPMKPMYAVTLNRADVLVVLGLEAEHAFIPGLLEAARIRRSSPTRPATSTRPCTSSRSRCRPGSTVRSAISTRWATRTTISIRCG